MHAIMYLQVKMHVRTHMHVCVPMCMCVSMYAGLHTCVSRGGQARVYAYCFVIRQART